MRCVEEKKTLTSVDEKKDVEKPTEIENESSCKLPSGTRRTIGVGESDEAHYAERRPYEGEN